MGDQQQCHAALALLGEQQVGDLPAGGLVEVAGRFVGDEDGRARRQRAGDRHALLLAAGQRAGIMRQALAKPDGFPKRAGRRMNVVLMPDKTKIEAAKRAIAKEKAAAEKAKAAEKGEANMPQQKPAPEPEAQGVESRE